MCYGFEKYENNKKNIWWEPRAENRAYLLHWGNIYLRESSVFTLTAELLPERNRLNYCELPAKSAAELHTTSPALGCIWQRCNSLAAGLNTFSLRIFFSPFHIRLTFKAHSSFPPIVLPVPVASIGSASRACRRAAAESCCRRNADQRRYVCGACSTLCVPVFFLFCFFFGYLIQSAALKQKKKMLQPTLLPWGRLPLVRGHSLLGSPLHAAV